MDLDPLTQEAQEARANALSLISAKLGGPDTYQAEINSLFGGSRNIPAAQISKVIYLVDALATIAETLLDLGATMHEEDEATQAQFVRTLRDPQELLALIDRAMERALDRNRGEES